MTLPYLMRNNFIMTSEAKLQY